MLLGDGDCRVCVLAHGLGISTDLINRGREASRIGETEGVLKLLRQPQRGIDIASGFRGIAEEPINPSADAETNNSGIGAVNERVSVMQRSIVDRVRSLQLLVCRFEIGDEKGAHSDRSITLQKQARIVLVQGDGKQSVGQLASVSDLSPEQEHVE